MDDNLEEAQVYLYSQPKDAQDQLRRIAEKRLQAAGLKNATAEQVEAVALKLVAGMLGNTGARIGEITEEEYRRIWREELDRLAAGNPSDTAGVSDDALLEAIAARLEREYGYLLEPKPRPPDPE